MIVTLTLTPIGLQLQLTSVVPLALTVEPNYILALTTASNCSPSPRPNRRYNDHDHAREQIINATANIIFIL